MAMMKLSFILHVLLCLLHLVVGQTCDILEPCSYTVSGECGDIVSSETTITITCQSCHACVGNITWWISDEDGNDIKGETDQRGIIVTTYDSSLILSIPAALINNGILVRCAIPTLDGVDICRQGVRIYVSTDGMLQ